MKKYILIQQNNNTGITMIYNDKKEAIKDGEYFRHQLTKHDRDTKIYVLDIEEEDILKCDNNCIAYEERATEIIEL